MLWIVSHRSFGQSAPRRRLSSASQLRDDRSSGSSSSGEFGDPSGATSIFVPSRIPTSPVVAANCDCVPSPLFQRQQRTTPTRAGIPPRASLSIQPVHAGQGVVAVPAVTAVSRGLPRITRRSGETDSRSRGKCLFAAVPRFWPRITRHQGPIICTCSQVSLSSRAESTASEGS